MFHPRQCGTKFVPQVVPLRFSWGFCHPMWNKGCSTPGWVGQQLFHRLFHYGFRWGFATQCGTKVVPLPAGWNKSCSTGCSTSVCGCFATQGGTNVVPRSLASRSTLCGAFSTFGRRGSTSTDCMSAGPFEPPMNLQGTPVNHGRGMKLARLEGIDRIRLYFVA